MPRRCRGGRLDGADVVAPDDPRACSALSALVFLKRDALLDDRHRTAMREEDHVVGEIGALELQDDAHALFGFARHVARPYPVLFRVFTDRVLANFLFELGIRQPLRLIAGTNRDAILQACSFARVELAHDQRVLLASDL